MLGKQKKENKEMKTKETKQQQQQDVLKKMHHVDKMGRELKGQPSEMERC